MAVAIVTVGCVCALGTGKERGVKLIFVLNIVAGMVCVLWTSVTATRGGKVMIAV